MAPSVQTVVLEPGAQRSLQNVPVASSPPINSSASPPTMADLQGDKLPTVDKFPPQLDDHAISGQMPLLSYSPEMPNLLMDGTPLSRYDEFSNVSKGSSDDDSSPRFMLDWGQMQMPLGYDGMTHSHLMMDADMSFDTSSLPISMVPPFEDMAVTMADLSNCAGTLMTPLETPKMVQSLLALELGSSVGLSHTHRHRSMDSVIDPMPAFQSSFDAQAEIPAIVSARDAWSAFRCTPIMPSSACAKTAKLNLERLEETLRDHESWVSWTPKWNEGDLEAGGDFLTVMQLHQSTRDKLLAITQSFLHKALEIHREGRGSNHGLDAPNSSGASNFVLLPPARVLEYFLRSYSNSFERYFPLTSRGILDPNELMHCYNDKAASLLVLLMIAQGAMNIPSSRARMLTGGLTEACRISLFDLVERNIIMSGDPIVLHSALLFTTQASWSGDKWQMDIAMGQRLMYMSMLRHSGMMERPTDQATTSNQAMSTESLWNAWIQNESRSRLIYSWVMLDQDLALFHDTIPLFSVTEFGAPMPDADRLWHAKTPSEWSSTFERVHEFSGGYSSVGSGARPLSLRDLFRHFLDELLIPMGIEMTPLQLRLLLHPLQSLVCQYTQLLSCFSDSFTSRNESEARVMSASSTRNRLEEVQSLLQRWFDLAERYLKANPICPMMQTNLVMFHLISLNAVTNFPEVERLARRENFDGTYQQLLRTHKRCIQDVEEATFHCGQVLRLIRPIPRGIRPPWWAAAIYRVALVLWTDSLTNKESTSPSNGMFPVTGPSFAIDELAADHPLIVRYLTKREGIPCVTKRDGSQMALDRAFHVLQHCVEVIDESASTRFSDAIKSKLERLSRG